MMSLWTSMQYRNSKTLKCCGLRTQLLRVDSYILPAKWCCVSVTREVNEINSVVPSDSDVGDSWAGISYSFLLGFRIPHFAISEFSTFGIGDCKILFLSWIAHPPSAWQSLSSVPLFSLAVGIHKSISVAHSGISLAGNINFVFATEVLRNRRFLWGTA